MRSQFTFSGMRYGAGGLARHDCVKCDTKDSLHKNGACIHCGAFRSTGVTITEGPKFTARQIAMMRRLA